MLVIARIWCASNIRSRSSRYRQPPSIFIFRQQNKFGFRRAYVKHSGINFQERANPSVGLSGDSNFNDTDGFWVKDHSHWECMLNGRKTIIRNKHRPGDRSRNLYHYFGIHMRIAGYICRKIIIDPLVMQPAHGFIGSISARHDSIWRYAPEDATLRYLPF